MKLLNKVWVTVFSLIMLVSWSTAVHADGESFGVSWKEISVGAQHSLGVKHDGTVWIWGVKSSSPNGSDKQIAYMPEQVKGLSDITAVSAANSYSLALKKDGTVWAWGWNEDGQLGNGNKTANYFPAQVEGLSHIVSIETDFSKSFAVKDDGTLYIWGGFKAEQPDGSYDFLTSPTEWLTFTDVKDVSAGYSHFIILKNDGTVWTTGTNYKPIQIVGLTDIQSVAAGASSSYALKKDGTVWAWGYNKNGALGDGTNTYRLDPVQIASLRDVIAVEASAGGPLYLKKDGTVWANGDNLGGQLGIGTYDDSNVPVQVKGLKKIVRIAAHGIGFRSAAVRADGTLWSWGNGYTGDGTEYYRTEPVWIKSYDTEVLQENPISIELNGKVLEFDQPPVAINERTMVPLRKIFEALGCEITWTESTQTVKAVRGKDVIELQIGSDVAMRNGVSQKLDAPSTYVHDRAFVPVRFIGESLGAQVKWDDTTQTVQIQSE